MIHKYDKNKEFHREIEIAWNKHDKKYKITKRSVFGKSSQGNSMAFSEKEMEYLVDLIKHK